MKLVFGGDGEPNIIVQLFKQGVFIRVIWIRVLKINPYLMVQKGSPLFGVTLA